MRKKPRSPLQLATRASAVLSKASRGRRREPYPTPKMLRDIVQARAIVDELVAVLALAEDEERSP